MFHEHGFDAVSLTDLVDPMEAFSLHSIACRAND
jgi:hypothetical protein